MKLGSVTDSTSLIADIGFWTGADSSSYSVSDRVRNINEWYRRVNSLIWENSGIWQFDDKNYTTLPIAETDLVDGQGDYTIPSTAQNLQQVEIQDNEGNWVVLDHFDPSRAPYAWEELFGEDNEDKGFPRIYDVVANVIRLRPTPLASDVTLTNGLRIYVSRAVSTFSVSDTSTTPGFSEDFHRMLSLGASLDYLVANDADNVRLSRVQDQIDRYINSLSMFYGTRNRDAKTRINPHRESRI